MKEKMAREKKEREFLGYSVWKEKQEQELREKREAESTLSSFLSFVFAHFFQSSKKITALSQSFVSSCANSDDRIVPMPARDKTSTMRWIVSVRERRSLVSVSVMKMRNVIVKFDGLDKKGSVIS